MEHQYDALTYYWDGLSEAGKIVLIEGLFGPMSYAKLCQVYALFEDRVTGARLVEPSNKS